MRKASIIASAVAVFITACVAGPWLAGADEPKADKPLKPAAAAKEAKPSDEAVARTRKQVQMLDDLYKNAIVLITTHYVTEESDVPAGAAFVALFDAMKKKGWHEVRLIDATGEPIEDKNAPQDEFEKAAIAKLKAGAGGYEQVVHRDGKPYLRSATPIPVVMDKCVMCHDHYKDYQKKGQIIGALGYSVPIE